MRGSVEKKGVKGCLEVMGFEPKTFLIPTIGYWCREIAG